MHLRYSAPWRCSCISRFSPTLQLLSLQPRHQRRLLTTYIRPLPHIVNCVLRAFFYPGDFVLLSIIIDEELPELHQGKISIASPYE